VGSNPEKLAATLRELARLDPIKLGLEAAVERIVQAAATAGAANTVTKASSRSGTAARDRGMEDHLGQHTAILPFWRKARSSCIGPI
jgi:hypothetical protein